MDPNTFHVSIGASDGFEFLFLTDGFLLSLVKSIFRHQVYLHTLAAPGVWLFTLVSLVAALLPDVVIRQILLIFLSCASGIISIRVLRKHWTTIEREAQIAK